MEQIDWNATASVITAIATVVLATLTAVYVIITNNILRKTAESVQEEHRPYVWVSVVVVEDFGFKLIISNTGKRMAYDVKVKFIPEITELESVSNRDGVFSAKHRLDHASLAPGGVIDSTLLPKIYFGYIKGFEEGKKGNIPDIYDIKITYYDSKGQWYTETYQINILALVKGRLYSTDPYLKKIEEAQKSLSSLALDSSLYRLRYKLRLLKKKVKKASSDQDKASIVEDIGLIERRIERICDQYVS